MLGVTEKQENYQKASDYWAKVPATIDGVLGGFGFVSDIDIQGSSLFLKSLLSTRDIPAKLALDCGAGIGRITKYLLIPHFEMVDLVESDEKFIRSVPDFVGDDETKLGTLYNSNLQDFQLEKKYNVIWNQWVLGHLDDSDLVSYLCKCRDALDSNGVIVIKENVTSSGIVEKDETDSCVTRPLKLFLEIFKKAKLKKVRQCKQTNFPKGLYPVYMFALIPQDSMEDTN